MLIFVPFPALTMTQILPMSDEETDAELTPIHASFLDPYILLIKNDHSAMVLKADARGEFDEVPGGSEMSSKQWRSGSVHKSSTETSDAMLYLLSDEGHLQVRLLCAQLRPQLTEAFQMFALPDLSKSVYHAPNLNLLPPVLNQDGPPRHADIKEELTELLVADIGEVDIKSPYLIVCSD